MIDWETFGARVPAGTRAKYNSPYSNRAATGIILENKPFHLIDREESSVYTQEWLRFEGFNGRYFMDTSPFYADPEELEYLIDGRWLTFAEVMQGDIPRAEG